MWNITKSLLGQPDEVIIKEYPNWGYSEFPAPGDNKKHLLPVLYDAEAEENLIKNEQSLIEETNEYGIGSNTAGVVEIKQFWMPDKYCKVCYGCEENFTMYRRKHHCRMCGQIFCNNCSSFYIEGKLFNTAGLVRACRLCFDQLSERQDITIGTIGVEGVTSGIKSSSRTKFHDSRLSNTTTANTIGGMKIESSIDRNNYDNRNNSAIGSISTADGGLDATAYDLILEQEKANRRNENLQNRASNHLIGIVERMLKGASSVIPAVMITEWKSIVVQLVKEVVSSVDPDVRGGGDSMDIRPYVKIKIIPGGNMDESVYLDGVIFRKNVSHKKMGAKGVRSNPRILLLAEGIEFQRADAKLSSMDTLIEQEDKHMEISVQKIMSLRPDVIMVGRAVARRAQELLCQHEVVVLQNVKMNLLERVSRMTGAMLLPSTDHMIKQYGERCLGTCEQFWLRLVQDDPEKAESSQRRRILKTRVARGSTYAYVQGCPVEKGCTLLLRGGDRRMLTEIKRIIKFSIVVAYHLRLEVAYYNDRHAELPCTVDNDIYDDGSDVDDAQEDVPYEAQYSDGVVTPPPPSSSDPAPIATAAVVGGAVEGLTEVLTDQANNEANNFNGSAPRTPTAVEVNAGALTSPVSSPVRNKRYSRRGSGGRSALNAAEVALSDEPLLRSRYERFLLSTSLDVDFNMPYKSELLGTKLFLNSRKLKNATCAESHQSLLIASLLMGENNSVPVQKTSADVKGIKYYTKQDIAFGQFLIDNCFQMNRIVNRESRMLDQTLSFNHRNGRVDISVHRSSSSNTGTGVGTSNVNGSNSTSNIVSTSNSATNVLHHGNPGVTLLSSSHMPLVPPGYAPTMQVHNSVHSAGTDTELGSHQNRDPVLLPIYLYSYCKECCRIVTPETLMSEETWKMSFGKFLEMQFYNRSARCTVGGCSHRIRDNHTLYARCEGYVAMFDFVPLHPYALHVRTGMAFPEDFHLQHTVDMLMGLPQKHVALIEEFRFAISVLEREINEILSTRPDDHALAMADVASMEGELVQCTRKFHEELLRTFNALPPMKQTEKVGLLKLTLIDKLSHLGSLSAKGIQDGSGDGRYSTSSDRLTILTSDLNVANIASVPIPPPTAFSTQPAIPPFPTVALPSKQRPISSGDNDSTIGNGGDSTPSSADNNAFSSVESIISEAEVFPDAAKTGIESSEPVQYSTDLRENTDLVIADSGSAEASLQYPHCDAVGERDVVRSAVPIAHNVLQASQNLHQNYKVADFDEDMAILFPAYHMRNTFLFASRWNTRMNMIYKFLESVRQLMMQQQQLQQQQLSTPAHQSSTSHIPLLSAIQSFADAAEAEQCEVDYIDTRKQLLGDHQAGTSSAEVNGAIANTPNIPMEASPIAIDTQKNPAVVSSPLTDHHEASPNDATGSSKKDTTLNSFSSKKDNGVYVVANSADNITNAIAESNSIIDSRESASAISAAEPDHTIHTHSQNTPTTVTTTILTKKHSDKTIDKVSRITKAISRFLVMGNKETVSAGDQAKFVVPLGDFGCGRFGLKPGRRGEIIPVHEDEYATIIAYSLASEDYYISLQEHLRGEHSHDDQQDLHITDAVDAGKLELNQELGRGGIAGQADSVIDQSSGSLLTVGSDLALISEMSIGSRKGTTLSVIPEADERIASPLERIEALDNEDSDVGQGNIVSAAVEGVPLKEDEANDSHIRKINSHEDEIESTIVKPTYALGSTPFSTDDKRSREDNMSNAETKYEIFPSRSVSSRIKSDEEETGDGTSAEDGDGAIDEIGDKFSLSPHEPRLFVGKTSVSEIVTTDPNLNEGDTYSPKAMSPVSYGAEGRQSSSSNNSPRRKKSMSGSSGPPAADEVPAGQGSGTSGKSANERVMVSQDKSYIRHRFDSTDLKGSVLCKFQCQTYWAKQFEAVRRCYFSLAGGDDEAKSEEHFIRSLATSVQWQTQGGKSGAAFSKTSDERFVLKVISRVELQMFLEFAPAYFEYMAKAYYHNLPTVLCKILGVYTVRYDNKETGKKAIDNVVVMENIFYQRNITITFDLKGSSRQRYVELGDAKGDDFETALLKRRHKRQRRKEKLKQQRENEKEDVIAAVADDDDEEEEEEPIRKISHVLMDDNLMELTKGRPFPLKHRAKMFFNKAVQNDTLFLSIVNVVDYSILVGFDEQNNEIIVGIIDYLRQYDIIKKMERMGKSVGMLTGQAEPTIIQPSQYRKRFSLAMERYFMTLPDKWISHDQQS